MFIDLLFSGSRKIYDGEKFKLYKENNWKTLRNRNWSLKVFKKLNKEENYGMKSIWLMWQEKILELNKSVI